ncbi:hypothetical protein ACNOYE_30445 [Nannocystaceae bacterium ST9]
MPAEYLVEKNCANILLSPHIVDGDLQLCYGEVELSRYAGLHVGRDPGQSIEFRVSDFEQDSETWVVTVAPSLPTNTGEWVRGPDYSSDTVNEYLTQQVEVTVEATSSQTGAKKKRKIYVKTSPKQGLPDPQIVWPNN